MIDKIRKIKYARMKPEERFLTTLFEELVKSQPILKGIINYSIKGEVQFQHFVKKNEVWCSPKIYHKLHDVCLMTEDDGADLVYKYVSEKLGLNDFYLSTDY